MESVDGTALRGGESPGASNTAVATLKSSLRRSKAIDNLTTGNTKQSLSMKIVTAYSNLSTPSNHALSSRPVIKSFCVTGDKKSLNNR